MRTPRTKAPSLNDLLKQYECGAVIFSGDPKASNERHLVFDHVVAPESASLRERFEAVARSMRDLLVQMMQAMSPQGARWRRPPP